MRKASQQMPKNSKSINIKAVNVAHPQPAASITSTGNTIVHSQTFTTGDPLQSNPTSINGSFITKKVFTRKPAANEDLASKVKKEEKKDKKIQFSIF